MRQYLLAVALFGVVTYAAAQGLVKVNVGAPIPASGFPQEGNLIVRYPFSDGSGATLTDDSGNSRDGTITGATWATCDTTENCLTFDGVGDEVAMPAGVYDTLEGETSWTACSWVEDTAYIDQQFAWTISGGSAATLIGLYPFDDKSGDGARVYSNGDIIDENGATAADGTLHLFCYVQRLATDHELFIDDAVSIGTSSSSKTVSAALTCGGLGEWCDNSSQDFTGGMSWHAFWSVDLTNSEISELYALGP